MDSKKADGEIRISSPELVDESKRYVRESSHVSLTDHHRIEGFFRNPLDNDRWGEQVVDSSKENYLEDVMEFDRYEPHNSDGQKELDEHQGASPLASSPSGKNVHERNGSISCGKSEKGCFLCGDVGHKMRNCPLELKRHEPSYREGPHPSDSTIQLRNQERYREPSASKRHQRSPGLGDSPTLQFTYRGRRKEFRDKKRNRRDYESREKDHSERARGRSSSSIRSIYTSSRSKSPSRSGRSLPQDSQLPSPSKLKSASLEKTLISSSLGSSPLHHSGSKSFELRSISRSMSPTFSLLPVEDSRNLSSSPNKIKEDSKGFVGNADGLARDMNLSEEEIEPAIDAGAVLPENIRLAVNDCGTKPAELKQGNLKNDPSEKNDHCRFDSRDSHELLETLGPQCDGVDQVVENSFLPSEKGTGDSPNKELIVAPTSDNSLRFNVSNSLKISSEEVCMILKHYGLQKTKENEKDLPVEIYFGSARLWPWEIIYYRRLKKGPISTENYSRRIAQNEEFGIVDKYIRGSSGWGELDDTNP